MILPRTSEGLYLLQRIRDEAHRFAITHHRSRRSKSMVESLLDDVPGLGEVRRKSLLKRFGSLKKLRAATVEEIAEVPGIGLRTAEAIVGALGQQRGPARRQREHRAPERSRSPDATRRQVDHRGEVVVVTGMTGAGRSTAAKELEDLGFFVVDNLPPQLVADVVRLVDETRGPMQPIAVVVDVRSGSFFAGLQEVLAQGSTGRRTTLLFLEANDEVLVRRQEAARRPHPLQEGGRLLDGLRRERVALDVLRADADLVIDTSGLNVHQLTAKVANAFGTEQHHLAQGHDRQLRLQVRHPGRRRPASPTCGSCRTRTGCPSSARSPAGTRTVAAYVKGRPEAQDVPRPVRPGAADRRRRLPPRGQALHDRRDRLHRRQAPQRRDDRGDRRPAAGRRTRRACRVHRDLGRE